MNIKRIAVIGAGVMGASIAAQVSNAGLPVILLDIVPEGASNRNQIAETAIKKLLKAEPAPLMAKRNAGLIQPGNIEDHLEWLAEVDWVIEAIVEKPAIKQALYQKLNEVCPDQTVISSNTSTLSLARLTEKMPDHFSRRFMISHFFNPPRYMRLMELVTSPQTDSALIRAVQQCADRQLGKAVVLCNDTPGFIANRIGIYLGQCAMLEAIDGGLTVEEADALIGPSIGIPKSGVFGLFDLVGLDLLPHVVASLQQALPADDPFHQVESIPEIMKKMVAEGYTGRKGKGGFYRLNRLDGERIKESIDLKTGDYRRSEKPQLAVLKAVKKEGIQALLSSDDRYGGYVWSVLSKTLCYAASLVPEIADDIATVDQAMRHGFNWQYGPFELLDQIGVAWFVERLKEQGRESPALLKSGQPLYKTTSGSHFFRDASGQFYLLSQVDGVVQLADFKQQQSALLSNPSVSLWDIGDGVACLEFTSKMNMLDEQSLLGVEQAIELVQQQYDALVIYNDGENFSVGANLTLLVAAIHQQDWSTVERLVKTGQQSYQALKYAPFPVVAAPAGLALGGGCEILLHCDAIQAHAELYTGLVEVGVGLVPGWGGCKEYLARQLNNRKRPGGPIPPIAKAFETIGTARVSKSASDARGLLFLRATDGITMNRDRLLSDAKAKALTLVADYTPPEPNKYPLPGRTAKILMVMSSRAFRLLGKATDYDMTVAKQLATVLSGGACDSSQPLSEAEMLNLEREAFLQLVQQPGTLARIEHTLKTGKPLRN